MRLGSIIDFSKSSSVKPNEIAPDAWILDLEDIEKDTGVLLAKKRMKDIQSKSDKHIFYSGNVLYSKLRPYLNKVIIADENGYCTSEILAFDFGMILNKYAQIYLMSPYFVDYAMSDAYGVKMPRLGSKQGNNALMPLPPFKEQVRIAEQLAKITPIVNRYASSQSELDRLNAELFEKLKKSVLQEAIQGKLVPQSPNDEPASVLLERIRAEKTKLFKEGKLKKKDLVDSVIFKGDDNKYYETIDGVTECIDEEIPFEIPDRWAWARGKTIFMPMQSTKPTGESFTYIDVDAVNNRKNIIDNAKCMLTSTAPSRATRKVWHNSILFSMVRPYLKNIALVGKEYCNAIASTGFYVIRPSIHLYPEYIFQLVLSTYVVDGLNKFMKGDNSPSINNEHIEEFLYPIPPANEQQRIICKLYELLGHLQTSVA